MEGFQKTIRTAMVNLPTAAASINNTTGSVSASSSDPTSLLLTRPPRRAVSLLTCSKLCGVFFVAGIVVGFSLKQRLRRWAARLLRRLKDD
uniref:uncharacterized protein LOC122579967 n=1 Tax=Erigeron canadensis TaxID=72917 RepID=UPI001CB90246|nr:uncharacterized protein LOC122579967 [Erigeron canadensis]